MWNYVLPSNELILDSDKVFFFDEDDWILLSFVFLLFFFFLLFFLPLCVSFSVSPSTKEQTSGCRWEIFGDYRIYLLTTSMRRFSSKIFIVMSTNLFFLRKNCLESFEKWKDESAKSSWNDLPQRSLSWTSSLNKQFTYARSRILAQWLGIHFHFSIADTENLRN